MENGHSAHQSAVFVAIFMRVLPRQSKEENLSGDPSKLRVPAGVYFNQGCSSILHIPLLGCILASEG